MKKIATGLFALAMVAAFAIQAFAAAPLFTEDFNYQGGSLLTTIPGWAAHSGAGTNPQTVNAVGMTYAGYPSSGIGGSLGPIARSGEDTNHGFTGITAGAAYAAVMVNVDSTQATGDYFFHFVDGAMSGNVFRARVFVKKDAATTNYAFGIQFGSTVNTVYTGFVYTPGTTHLLVLKYTFNPAALDDQASLFVDPAVSCTEPAATISAVDATQTDATNIDFVCIRQGSAGAAAKVQLDGIRIANNWADAVCAGVVPTRSSTWGQVKSLYR